MNLPLLKAKLSHSGEKELSNAVLFLYKALPKKEKEKIDDGLVAILDGEKKDTKVVKKEVTDSKALLDEISTFVYYANHGFYNYPNRWVPKKKRARWRMMVKDYYRKLISIDESDVNYLPAQRSLYQIYQLMLLGKECDAFNTRDTFSAIQIPEETFKREVEKRYYRLNEDHDYVKSLIDRALRESIGSDPTSYNHTDIYVSSILLKDQAELSVKVLKEIVESTTKELEMEQKKNPSFNSTAKENRIDMALDMMLSLSFKKEPPEFDYYFTHKRTSDMEETLYQATTRCLKKWVKDKYIVKFMDQMIEKYNIIPRKEIQNYYNEVKRKVEEQERMDKYYQSLK